LIKNSQPFGKKIQKTVGGGFFLTHTVGTNSQVRLQTI